ncbi:hypothetical protein LUZ60_011927 [Juncus effusus]|nr:hypothetical protein LUZ60_011927 [Juncus effusus]
MAVFLKPKTLLNLSSPFLSLKLLSSTTSLTETSSSSSKLFHSLHALLLNHHQSNPSSSPVPPPLDLSIPSLSASFSNLTSTPPRSSLAVELIHKVSSLRHGHPFPQTLCFFNWYISFNHSPASLSEIYTAMIDFSAKLQYFPLAHQLLDRMLALEIPIESNTITTLIRRYIRANKPSEAIELFNQLSHYKLKPDPSFLANLLSSLSKKRLAQEAQQIFDSFKSTILPDVVLYSTLINAWCRAGQLDKAEKLFAEMGQTGLNPNVYTYTCVIDAMCRSGQLPRAQELLCQMISSGCQPNTATFNAIVRAHLKAGRAELVLQVHNQMKQLGLEPDIITYNFLIESHCGKNQKNLEAALKVLNQMVAKNCNPNCHSFNPIFGLLVSTKNIKAAHNLYDKMRELKVQPNTVTFNYLINLFNKEKKMDMVLRIKKEMEKEGVEPNVNTYGALISVYCERGNWRRAVDAIMEMIQVKGLKPTDSVYRMVVDQLRKNGQIKKCKDLREIMVQKGFVVDKSGNDSMV